MSTFKPRRTHGLGVLVATVALIFGSAGPAAAYQVQAGGSGGTGWELGPNFTELCSHNNVFTGAEFPTTYYIITHQTNDYLIRSDSGAFLAYYQGSASMNVQHGEAVLGPQGSMNGPCTGQAFIPNNVPLTKATVDGQSGVGRVNCQMKSNDTNGYYYRTNNSITIQFRVYCSVTGNTIQGSAHNVPITHTVVGTQTPCFEVPGGCTNGDAGSLLTTSWSGS